METPLISVIMPSYKSNEDWIIQAIDSVLEQTYKNLELIIVCDEPTREIEALIQKYVKNDKRVKYVKNNKKFNIWKALNQWIFLSEWKYIARIDDDDIWDDKDKIKKQVEYMEFNEDCWLCWVNKVLNIDQHWYNKNIVYMRKSDSEIRNTILQSNQFSHPSVMIRKESLEKSWVYDVSCFTEDYDLWCRIWKFYKFCNIDSSIKYRLRNDSLWHKNFFKVKIKSFKVFWKYKKYYPNSFRAFILRFWDFFLSERIKNNILKLLKKECW